MIRHSSEVKMEIEWDMKRLLGDSLVSERCAVLEVSRNATFVCGSLVWPPGPNTSYVFGSRGVAWMILVE